jgi:hypothetical protein
VPRPTSGSRRARRSIEELREACVESIAASAERRFHDRECVGDRGVVRAERNLRQQAAFEETVADGADAFHFDAAAGRHRHLGKVGAAARIAGEC